VKKKPVKHVLFVCIRNASRSQMAEGLAKMTPHRGVRIYSAGIEPGKEVNPAAVRAMKELGYDLSGHECNHVSDYKHITFDFVAKMDAEWLGDAVKAKWVEHWNVPDPANGGIREHRLVRDMLAERVEALFRRGKDLYAAPTPVPRSRRRPARRP